MNNNPFYIVDVFSEQKYTGNQLAVFRHAEQLSTEEMQTLAQEMHFSESTFILSETKEQGGYPVRIFTPEEEVPFAGHPTLGTAHIIRTFIAPNQGNEIILNYKVGQIPVTYHEDDDIYWMKQIEPIFGEQLSTDKTADALGLALNDVDLDYPIEEVSTGLPFILVPLKDLESLQKAHIVHEKYRKLIEHTKAKFIFLFCPQTHEAQNQISARMFTPLSSIPEDPATGSANGCLAGYMVQHKYKGLSEVDLRCEQGYEIGRPSLLYLKAKEKGGHIHIQVGGRVKTVACGELV